jgi:hypothetical protein
LDDSLGISVHVVLGVIIDHDNIVGKFTMCYIYTPLLFWRSDNKNKNDCRLTGSIPGMANCKVYQ